MWSGGPPASLMLLRFGLTGYVLGYVVLLMDRHSVPKLALLSCCRAQVGRKHPENEHFNVVHHFYIIQNMPTEVIPQLSASLAACRLFNSMAYMALPNVNRHGAVVEYIDSLPASGVCPDPFDVFLVSRPHCSVLGHNWYGSRFRFVRVHTDHYGTKMKFTESNVASPFLL